MERICFGLNPACSQSFWKSGGRNSKQQLVVLYVSTVRCTGDEATKLPTCCCFHLAFYCPQELRNTFLENDAAHHGLGLHQLALQTKTSSDLTEWCHQAWPSETDSAASCLRLFGEALAILGPAIFFFAWGRSGYGKGSGYFEFLHASHLQGRFLWFLTQHKL